MILRSMRILALVLLSALAGSYGISSGLGRNGRVIALRLFIEDSTGARVTDQYNGTVRMYRSQTTDTTGTTVWYTVRLSDSSWTCIDPPEDIYRVRFESDSATFIAIDSLHIKSWEAGDTTITSQYAFADTVLPGRAIRIGAIWPIHFDGESTYTIDIGSASTIHVDAIPASIMRGAAYADSLAAHGMEDSSWVKADADTLTADSTLIVEGVTWDDGSGNIDGQIIANATIHDSAVKWSGAGSVNLTDMSEIGGAAKSAGYMFVADGGDYHGVYISNDISVAADGTFTIIADAIEESMLKCVNTSADEDILTRETTTGDYEWHTPAELALYTLGTAVPKINPGRIKSGTINPFASSLVKIYDATSDSGAVITHWWRGAAPHWSLAGIPAKKCVYDLSIRCPVDDTLYVTWGSDQPLGAGCDSTFYYVILFNPDD